MTISKINSIFADDMTKEDILYVKEAFDKKDTYFKPDVKRIIRMYNEIMDDKKHIFHPVSEQICACSLRPYLIQLYRKMQEQDMFKDEKTVEPAPKPPKKKGSRKK